MRGLFSSDQMIMLAFAVIIGILSIIFFVDAIDPMKSEHAKTTALANSIALDLDSLLSVDEGKIEMEIAPDTNCRIRVIYHKAGKKDGYTVDKDGYYVVVSIDKIGRTVYGIKRLDAYPSSRGDIVSEVETDIWKPKRVCITKNPEAYPIIREWHLGC